MVLVVGLAWGILPDMLPSMTSSRDSLHDAVKIPNHLEPTGLHRSDGKRPDGATIIPWKVLVWDATCPDTGTFLLYPRCQGGWGSSR